MIRYKNILVVPDSFKNSLSADEVVTTISNGLNYYKGDLNIETLPFADGGEGSLVVIERYRNVIKRKCFAFDAFLNPITAEYYIDTLNSVAYIESARIIGIEVIERDPDCYNASSYGLGHVIADALDQDVKSIYIFLGGSATCDGGIGMAAALGYEIYVDNRLMERPIAKDIKFIQRISKGNVHKKLSSCVFIIGYDVDVPLCGEHGTAYNYAKQKGASSDQIELLELAMLNFSKVIWEDKKVDIQNIKGAGAAGGLGAGCFYFLNGKLNSAFLILAEIANLEEKIKNSDLIISGEGHIDKQSFDGKLISQISKIANKYDIPIWLVSAIRSVSRKEVLKRGFARIESLYRSYPKVIDNNETERKLFRTAKKWAAEILDEEE